ncbi:MAG: hypothetical protein PHF14_08265 [Verrucomicrobiota bacterium]|nr:hypothetical protein [Verrucomicrobiota bacterium]
MPWRAGIDPDFDFDPDFDPDFDFDFDFDFDLKGLQPPIFLGMIRSIVSVDQDSC